MLLTPGWALFSVLCWAAAIAMIFLGRWQLIVSDEKGFDWQNFGYSLQWWTFSLAAVVFWAKLVRDALRGRQPDNVSTGGELVVRGRGTGIAPAGPATLMAPGADATPTIYRGYVMPQSATHPDRSDGDLMRGAYNDYLWQLALADSAAPEPAAARQPPPHADEHAVERPAIEPGTGE
jgi:hypothetical protein